jgi:hypothetical protein
LTLNLTKLFGPKVSETSPEELELGKLFILEFFKKRLQRKKNEDENGKGKYYTYAQHVPVESFDNLKTEITKVKDDK